MKLSISAASKRKISPVWTTRRINAITRRVEKITGLTLPSWQTIRIHDKRRGYGTHGGKASVPTWALLPDKAELYGIYYIVHELLHVLRFDHGTKMQSMERKIVETFGGRLCYGPNNPNYPVSIKKGDEVVCNEHGFKPVAWFYEI